MSLTHLKSRTFNLSALSYSVCNNGTALSNGYYSIPSFVSKTDEIESVYIMVAHAEIPNSFYLINKTNNCIVINNIAYYVVYGNYNASSLITALLTILPSSFSIIYNSIYQKFTIQNNTYGFTISYSKSTITRIMGLSRTADMDSLYLSPYFYATLPNVVNFLPNSRLSIRSSKLGLENFNAYDKSSDTLVSVQNNASQNGMITYINYTGSKYVIDIESLNDLDLRITDDNNNEIDFNGVNWFISLRIDYEYKNNYKQLNSFRNILDNNNLYLQSLAQQEENI